MEVYGKNVHTTQKAQYSKRRLAWSLFLLLSLLLLFKIPYRVLYHILNKEQISELLL
jgi:hypothetical protein